MSYDTQSSRGHSRLRYFICVKRESNRTKAPKLEERRRDQRRACGACGAVCHGWTLAPRWRPAHPSAASWGAGGACDLSLLTCSSGPSAT